MFLCFVYFALNAEIPVGGFNGDFWKKKKKKKTEIQGLSTTQITSIVPRLKIPGIL